MNWKTLAGAFMVMIIAGCGFNYFTTSPEYSLLQVRKAVESHDVALFQKHVDVDGVLSRLVDDVLAHQVDTGARTANSDQARFAQKLGVGLVTLMKPAMVKGLKNASLRYVAYGSPSADQNGARASSQSDDPLENLKSSIGFNSKKDKLDYTIEKDGKRALLVVPFKHDRLAIPLELQIGMRDVGGYWQITEIQNTVEILDRVAEAKSLAAKGPATQ